MEKNLIYWQWHRYAINVYNFRVFSMLWLSRTFAMSNKVMCPMNVRDSGCRLYYSLISTFDAGGIGKYRY